MSSTNPESVAAYLPTVDLNELCFDHPGAGFIFQLDSDFAIVDCAAIPLFGCLVITERNHAYSLEFYEGQNIFGVITHIVRRIT
jgi:hypothetical protein